MPQCSAIGCLREQLSQHCKKRVNTLYENVVSSSTPPLPSTSSLNLESPDATEQAEDKPVKDGQERTGGTQHHGTICPSLCCKVVVIVVVVVVVLVVVVVVVVVVVIVVVNNDL